MILTIENVPVEVFYVKVQEAAEAPRLPKD